MFISSRLFMAITTTITMFLSFLFYVVSLLSGMSGEMSPLHSQSRQYVSYLPTYLKAIAFLGRVYLMNRS